MKLKSGFSLIELLVVVAIIGILAAIGTVGYNKYVESAGAGSSTANAKQLADALTAEDTKVVYCSAQVNGADGDTAQGCLGKLATQFNISTTCGANGAVRIGNDGTVDNCKDAGDSDFKSFPPQIGNNFKN